MSFSVISFFQFEVPTVVYADDNTPVHTIVAYAKACDPDSAPYNRMSYELYTGNNSGTFLCRLGSALRTADM